MPDRRLLSFLDSFMIIGGYDLRSIEKLSVPSRGDRRIMGLQAMYSWI